LTRRRKGLTEDQRDAVRLAVVFGTFGTVLVLRNVLGVRGVPLPELHPQPAPGPRPAPPPARHPEPPKRLTLEPCRDCGRFVPADELVHGSCCGRAA